MRHDPPRIVYAGAVWQSTMEVPMPTLRPHRDDPAVLSTLLVAALPADEERPAVADVSALRAGDFLRVDDELMWIRSAAPSPLAVARGFAGTAAVAHAAGASVWRLPAAIPEQLDAPPLPVAPPEAGLFDDEEGDDARPV